MVFAAEQNRDKKVGKGIAVNCGCQCLGVVASHQSCGYLEQDRREREDYSIRTTMEDSADDNTADTANSANRRNGRLTRIPCGNYIAK